MKFNDLTDDEATMVKAARDASDQSWRSKPRGKARKGTLSETEIKLVLAERRKARDLKEMVSGPIDWDAT